MKNLALTLLLMTGYLCSSSQEVFTLSDAIKIGLENNYAIKISDNEASIATNNYTRGNAGFLPRVDLNASKTFTRSNVKQEFLDGRVNEVDGASSDNLNYGISLNWTLFDGLKMFITYEKLNELRLAGNLNVERTIENTIRDISAAYYRVIFEQARVGILDSSLRLSEERLSISKSKYEVGKASKLEYLAAQVDYNADRSAIILQREFLINARVELNRLLNREVDIEFEVQESIDVDSTLILEDLVSAAEKNNKDLLIAKSNLDVSNYEFREIGSERFPQVAFNAGWSAGQLNSESGFLRSNKSDGFTYGFSAAWNVFNGFDVQRRIQNARLTVANSEFALGQIELDLVAQIKSLYLNYANNLELLQLEQANFQIALENAEIALERYRLGNTNALELREAQNNSVSALGRLTDASFNTKVAELDLLFLSGLLIN